jgi:hypothetical protein
MHNIFKEKDLLLSLLKFIDKKLRGMNVIDAMGEIYICRSKISYPNSKLKSNCLLIGHMLV